MRRSFIRLACLALPLVLAACGKPASQPETQAQNEIAPAAPAGAEGQGSIIDRSHAGSAAPTTPFLDPAGGKVTIADFRGKPLLVNLWATWCAPCVIEMPTLDTLAGRERDSLQVLPISQDLDGADKVRAFFAKMKFTTLKPYIDADSELSNQLKVQTLPTTILYDAQGKEVWRITGKEDWTGPQAAALLKEGVKG